jgi:hypothetical protein
LPEEDVRTGALPERFRRLARQAPEGMQGVGAFDVDSLLARPLWDLFGGSEWLPEDPDAGDESWLQELRALLESDALNDPVAFTAWHDHRWSYLVLW